MKINCPCCNHEIDTDALDNGQEPDDGMDGDAGSALASAGFGTDEDYEHNLFDEGGE